MTTAAAATQRVTGLAQRPDRCWLARASPRGRFADFAQAFQALGADMAAGKATDEQKWQYRGQIGAGSSNDSAVDLGGSVYACIFG